MKYLQHPEWSKLLPLAARAGAFVIVASIAIHDQHAPGGLSVPPLAHSALASVTGTSLAVSSGSVFIGYSPQPVANQVADGWYSQKLAVAPMFLQRAAWYRQPPDAPTLYTAKTL